MRQVFYGFWTVEFCKLVNVPGNALRVMAVAKKDSENTDKDMQTGIRYFFFYHVKLMVV